MLPLQLAADYQAEYHRYALREARIRDLASAKVAALRKLLLDKETRVTGGGGPSTWRGEGESPYLDFSGLSAPPSAPASPVAAMSVSSHEREHANSTANRLSDATAPAFASTTLRRLVASPPAMVATTAPTPWRPPPLGALTATAPLPPLGARGPLSPPAMRVVGRAGGLTSPAGGRGSSTASAAP